MILPSTKPSISTLWHRVSIDIKWFYPLRNPLSALYVIVGTQISMKSSLLETLYEHSMKGGISMRCLWTSNDIESPQISNDSTLYKTLYQPSMKKWPEKSHFFILWYLWCEASEVGLPINKRHLPTTIFYICQIRWCILHIVSFTCPS